MADYLNGLFFRELLAETAGNSTIDSDGDTPPLTADKFIEIGNASNASMSLAGYQIWSERSGLLFSFGLSDVLNSGDVATIVGNITGTPPPGFYRAYSNGTSNILHDSAGNKTDSIFLVNSNTGDYIVISYGTPPSAPGNPSHATGQSPFPGTNQIGTGESIHSTTPNGVAFGRGASGKFIETTPAQKMSNMACFAEDTIILTNRGEIPIADVHPGDRIPTYDVGTQTLLGVCRKHFSPGQLLQSPSLRPLTLDHTLFGGDAPLRVSPGHCTLYRSTKAETLFTEAGVLLRGEDLQDAGFARMEIPRTGVTYYHLLFKNHVLVFANGIWSESYYNTPELQENSDWDLQWSMIPGMSLANTRHERPARTTLRKHEAMVLLKGLKPTGAQRPSNKFNPIPLRIVG